MYGGHRLWHAPEAMSRSCVPDNDGVHIEATPDGVRLSHPAELATGISKRVEVRLHADRPAVTMRHSLTNEGVWTVECAPWAITQLPLGGVAIVPQQAGPLDADGVQPNRHLALWPYARWRDPRLHLDDGVILVEAQPLTPPFKIGCFNRDGWIAYLRGGLLFVKRFEPQPDRSYPDFNSNAEVYSNNRFIELETLAPLQRLEPGQTAAHVETWEVYTGIDAPPTLDGARVVVNLLNSGVKGHDEQRSQFIS
jgi:hypothetical protein